MNSEQCTVFSVQFTLLYSVYSGQLLQMANNKYNGAKETLSSSLLRAVRVECREAVEAKLKYRESEYSSLLFNNPSTERLNTLLYSLHCSTEYGAEENGSCR